jgi:hypothetical protein
LRSDPPLALTGRFGSQTRYYSPSVAGLAYK